MAGSATQRSGETPFCLRFRYGPVVTDVWALDPDVVYWLAEFLAPSFDVRAPDATPPEHRVTVSADVRRVVDLTAARDVAERTLEVFGLDGSFTTHAAWGDPDGGTWISAEQFGGFVRIGDDARQVDVVAASCEGSTRPLLMRVVRELATIGMARAGHLPVHGAAITIGDGVVLICGPKRAGKSSLLVHALECGASFVSNDRVFVGGADCLTARGMPTLVSLRNGTLERFDALRREFEARRYDRALTIRACAPGIDRPDPPTPPGHDRPVLGPAQFCRLLDAPMERGGAVRAVIFPQIETSARGLALEERSRDGALADMRGSLLKPSDPLRLSPAFTCGDPVVAMSAEQEEAYCRRLIEQVPTYRCRLGPDAYEHDLLHVLAGVC